MNQEHKNLLRQYIKHRLEVVERMLQYAAEADSVARETLREALIALGAQAPLYEALAAQRGLTLPDAALASRHDLDPTDVHLLWIAAAPLLDPTLLPLIGRASDASHRRVVTPALCMKMLASSRLERLDVMDRLQPGARLHALGLLELMDDPGVHYWTRRCLAPRPHVSALLAGARTLSADLDGVARRVTSEISVDELGGDAALRELLLALQRHRERGRPREAWFREGGVHFRPSFTAVLTAPDGSGRSLAIRAIAKSLGRPLIILSGPRLATMGHHDAVAALRAAFEEAEVHDELLLIRDADALLGAGASPDQEQGSPATAHALRDLILQRTATLLITASQPPEPGSSLADVVSLCVPLEADHGARASMVWQLNTPEGYAMSSEWDAFERVERRVRLTPEQTRDASQLLHLLAPPSDKKGEEGQPRFDAALVERCAASQLRTSEGRLVKATAARASLDQLVLPPDTMDHIKDLISAYRNRRQVLVDWGLGRHIRRGTGLLCLFNGEPGTGKTFAAGVIAQELGLELSRVDVSGVVDKYIGETEKNLTKIFENVAPDRTLLLFDEADSLFSKRTSVRSTNDRHANMEVNVLLQLAEEFKGIAILTTNLKGSMDSAFLRRLAYKVDFPTPDEVMREQIWRNLLPPHVPTGETIDHAALADSVELSGGSIKNAILRAAYAAAAEGALICNHHLHAAAEKEAAAEGRLVRTVTKSKK